MLPGHEPAQVCGSRIGRLDVLRFSGPHTPEGSHLFANGAVCPMLNDNNDDHRHRLKVRLLFGFFEADATGTVAIGAALVFLMLVGAGRWWTLW